MTNLEEIQEHFKNISVEEFEQSLVECGLNTIKPSTDFGYRMLSPEECEKFLSEARPKNNAILDVDFNSK